MSRGFTNKTKASRAPVGPISIEAVRLAWWFCKHEDTSDVMPCRDCQAEAQAAINLSKERYGQS
jgi:hypothetical protein